jgi:molybdopterin-guanine dinucleotide biosynthesis protein A
MSAGSSVVDLAASSRRGFNAALLAGGKSRRMGRDKAFIEVGGVPLWKKQIAILQELSPDEIFISGPPHEEWTDWQIVPDVQADAGPLGGIVACLRRCTHRHLLVLAVDLPRMNAGVLSSLLRECDVETGVVPCSEDRFEPLAAIYPQRCLPLAERCLRERHFTLQEFVARAVSARLLRARPVAAQEREFFLNANTPADIGAVTPL